jgi:hypothetical protein
MSRPFPTNEQLVAVLQKHQLQVSSLHLLRDSVEIAFEAASCDVNISARAAESLVATLRRLEAMPAFKALATKTDAAAVAALRARATLETGAWRQPGPRPRLWLWPACINFWDFWRFHAPEPGTLWTSDDRVSPGLDFLTACCGLVDKAVTPSAILRAKDEYERAELTPEELDAAYQRHYESEQ